MDRKERLEGALVTVVSLRAGMVKRLALLDELERALLQDWARETGVNTIAFDVRKLKRLKKAYAKAVTEGVTQFTFEDNVLLVSYARLLIQYLDTQFGGLT